MSKADEVLKQAIAVLQRSENANELLRKSEDMIGVLIMYGMPKSQGVGSIFEKYILLGGQLQAEIQQYLKGEKDG